MAKTYHISFNNTDWTEFCPSNSPIVSYERQGNEMFLRYKVNEFRIARNVGSIDWLIDHQNNFIIDVNGDKISGAGNEAIFDTIYTMFFDSTEFSNPLYFKIQKNGVDKYIFESSVNESEIDTQNGVFSISPRTDDNYKPVIDNYETKYGDRAGTALFAAGTIYVPTDPGNSFVNNDFATFSDVAKLVNWTCDAVGGAEQSADYLLGTNFNGQIVQFTIANFITDGNPLKFRLIDSNDGTTVVSAADAIVSSDGVYTLTQNASSTGAVYWRMTQANAAGTKTGSYDYEVYEPVAKTSAGDDLYDFIQRLIGGSFMATGLTLKSTYLWNDALETDAPPNIDTYITANPTNDYVVEGAAIWNDLFFTRTDVWTTNQNTTAEISLKEVMDILKGKLRAWWFIDSDGNFRIEHEYYFRDYATQIDLTSGTYSEYKPEVDVKDYIYDKGNIVNTLSYSSQNDVNNDFVASPIIYDPILTTPNVRDIVIDITTDIQNVIDNPGSASNSGFTLLRCLPLNTDYVIAVDENTLIPGTFNLNAKLGWAYLFTHYFKYFGEGETADINDGTTLTLLGVKEFLKQNDIRFKYEGELNWKRPVTVTNGLGWIEKISESDSEYLTLNIGFDPYA